MVNSGGKLDLGSGIGCGFHPLSSPVRPRPSPGSTRRDPPMPQIQAVAFDCDGLLVNTEDVFELAGNDLLARRGHAHTPEVRGLMLGKRAGEAFGALIDHLSLTDTVDGLIEEVGVLFRGHAEGRLALMPGAVELLDRVAAAGLPAAVCTSSGGVYLAEMLDRFDLTDRFAVRLAAEDVTRGKPDPEIYRAAADKLGVPVGKMLVLEDSGTGCAAGVASGAVTVAVPNRHTAAMDFAGAAFVADGLGDARIAELVGG